MSPGTTRRGLRALAAVAILFGGCKDRDSATPAADSARIGVEETALRVTDVKLGRSVGPDKKVLAELDDFAAADTIYASVETSGTGSGALAANWTFQDGQVVEHSEQSVSTTGPAVTEFHISKPTPWPVGEYKVTITLNGQVVGSEEFEVK